MIKKAVIDKVILKLSKGEDVSYKRHSTQINLNDCMGEKDYNFYKLQQKIPLENIYREFPQINNKSILGLNILEDDPREEYGMEAHAHITVLYGIKEECDYFNIRKALKNFGEIDFKIGNISSFRNPDTKYDVLKLEIISEKLNELHEFLKKNYKNDFKFPEYNPHMTFAYIKKGTCKELEGKCAWTGAKYTAKNIKFSHIDKYKLDIPLI